MSNIHPVLTEIIDTDRKHDPFGAAMMALGAILDVLWASEEGDAEQAQSQYRPSPLWNRNVEQFREDTESGENYYQHMILAALDETFDPGYYVPEFVYDLDVDDLRYAARVLSRYIDIVTLAGKDY